MPRSERRRWWIERQPQPWRGWPWRFAMWINGRTIILATTPTRREVAMFRLAQWLRIRLAYTENQYHRIVVDAMEQRHDHEEDLLDADAAVREARVSEERRNHAEK